MYSFMHLSARYRHVRLHRTRFHQGKLVRAMTSSMGNRRLS
jgi:hypothetical protein